MWSRISHSGQAVTIVATNLTSLGSFEVADAKDRQTRYEILTQAELDGGSSHAFLVAIDGMGAISVGLSLLRLLVEIDTPRRLGLFGVTSELSPLIDAWEACRLDELTSSGRLKLARTLDAKQLLAQAVVWATP